MTNHEKQEKTQEAKASWVVRLIHAPDAPARG